MSSSDRSLGADGTKAPQVLKLAREALKAVQQAWRNPQPRKLDAALAWVENDKLVERLIDAALLQIDHALASPSPEAQQGTTVHVHDGDWIEPTPQIEHRMVCCDCGLTHSVDFRVEDGKVQYRVYRDEQRTIEARMSQQEPTELDRQIEEYKQRADRREMVSASDAVWLLNELIYERDRRASEAAHQDEDARLLALAIEYHKSPEGEGEYGCNGATCPGVQRLFALLKRAAPEAVSVPLIAAELEAAERANVAAQQKTLQLEQDVAALRATQAAVLRLAKEATSGWACYAKRQSEHDEIARLHREIAKLETADSGVNESQ